MKNIFSQLPCGLGVADLNQSVLSRLLPSWQKRDELVTDVTEALLWDLSQTYDCLTT